MLTILERFTGKYVIDEVTGCWNWIAAMRGNCGYGCIIINNKVESSHRIAYKLYKGEIPANKIILHSCDNRRCVNPNHLSVGTHKDNYKDMSERNKKSEKDILEIAAKIRNTMKKYEIHPSLSQYNKGCRCIDCKQLKSEAYQKRKNK